MAYLWMPEDSFVEVALSFYLFNLSMWVLEIELRSSDLHCWTASVFIISLAPYHFLRHVSTFLGLQRT